jgi:hypothetical protein
MNTYSTDLEKDSSQCWSILDTAQTGLDITGDISMEIWAKPESAPTENISMSLLRKWHAENSAKSYNFYYKNVAGVNKLVLGINNSSDNIEEYFLTYTLETGVWCHLAVTWDASESTAKFYVNGTKTGDDQVGVNTDIKNSESTFVIGGRPALSGDFFDGRLDEARIWNDIRTDSEISNNYQTELVGDEQGLVAYWKFNNDAGVDYTANNNDLTNNNSCTFSVDIPFDGINIKSINGLSRVSGKSINSVALSDINNINDI